jgi:hypothetical protein
MTIAWLVAFSLLMQSKISHFADTPKVNSVFSYNTLRPGAVLL